MKLLLSAAICLLSFSLYSQNLVLNGDFSAANANWNNGGCSLEINTQAIYGGTGSDLVGEIDAGSCAEQTICVVPGLTYTLSYDACRRTGGTCTPAIVGMNILVTGVTSGVNYVNANNNYSNTTFSLVTQTYSFTAGATDRQVTLRFGVFNNLTTCGVIINNVSLVIDPALTISGPSLACTLQPTNWLVNNITGGVGVTYNWNFSSASPAASTAAAPAGVTWSSAGINAISCVIGNGTCNVTTLNTIINISCTLPVYMINFSANRQSNAVVLSWTTLAEINNRHFRVQRSANGREFYDIGLVNAGSGNYSFTDGRPLASLNYYRLVQVDNDGRSVVSNIIKLADGSDTEKNLVIYSNPVNEKLVFTYHVDKNTGGTIKLFDLAGRLMQQNTTRFTNGFNSKEINVEQLSKGVYLLEVVNGLTQQKSIVRFMKN